MKTNCAKNCSSEDEGKCQPFPKNEPLAKSINFSLKKLKEDLKEKLKDETGQLYIYILTTVQKDANNGLIQTGSAPNFQGGYITLCSCKHRMRATKKIKQLLRNGKSIWIAGFTDKQSGNWLFYLMKVQKTFLSQKAFWNGQDILCDSVLKAKSAKESVFGDIYKPMSTCNDPFDFSQYYEPRSDHVHAGSADFNCFKKTQVTSLYNALVNDSIIKQNNQNINPDIFKTLLDILSNPKLSSEIIDKLKNTTPHVKNYIAKLSTIYVLREEPEDLKKLNRYLLEQRYPQETEKINSNTWQQDICYPREPLMLVGDPNLSFIWSEQKIKKPSKSMSKNGENCDTCKELISNARGHRVCDIQSFLSCLEETNK